tara:strand:- start:132 stop:362 length:231 start_codon:yes stop_codon:yes gene_type:complete
MDITFYGKDTDNFNNGDILTVTISYQGDYGGKKVTFSGIYGSVSKFDSSNEIEEGDQFMVRKDSIEGRSKMSLEKI